MDSQNQTPDWEFVQSFLAVAETGSLSAAASRLGQSQPTVGRHIKALEEAWRAELFHRHARGLRLTETGETLLPMAQTMRDAMYQMTLRANGQSQEVSGVVRITASDVSSHYVLPPIIARIRAAEPAIQIVLVATDATENLLFREADIAVRMYRPQQLDVITQHICDVPVAIFAAKSYLDQRGRPHSPEDLLNYDLVGYDTDELIVRSMRDMGWHVQAEDFAVRCDTQSANWELVRAGCGVGFTQRSVGVADSAVEEIDLGLPMPSLPVWLTADESLRRTPRVSRIWDLLRAELAQLV
ncbi:MAG: LysR family transcriptional regulator [Rhodobacteraceae bacterium]|nr:LysR family transcriptional regulator [Paracoccaceae bacterium]